MKWDDLKRESFRFLEDAALLVVFVVVLYLLVSCRSVKYVPVEKVRTDTTYITQHERDSIFVHDSVHTKESQKGGHHFRGGTKMAYQICREADTRHTVCSDA